MLQHTLFGFLILRACGGLTHGNTMMIILMATTVAMFKVVLAKICTYRDSPGCLIIFRKMAATVGARLEKWYK